MIMQKIANLKASENEQKDLIGFHLSADPHVWMNHRLFGGVAHRA